MVELNRRKTDENLTMKEMILGKKRQRPVTRRSVPIVPVKDMILYNRLAEIKIAKKALDAEYLSTFDKLESGKRGLIDRVDTKYGELLLKSRTSWQILSMASVFLSVGKAKFLQYCSIGREGIIKAIGDDGFDKLVNAGSIESGDSTSYYQLTVDKE